MPESRIIKCPFCQQGDIIANFTPKTMVTKIARAASNRKAITYFKDEKYSVISKECPACHKSKSSIQKFFKEGKSTSMAEAARKAKKLGFPTKI